MRNAAGACSVFRLRVSGAGDCDGDCCDCAGDASCVLRFCRAISLDAPKVADVHAAADCVEDLRGAAPDEVEAICAQWKVLAKGKFRRAVAALQEEVRQGADGAFDLDDAAPVTPAAAMATARKHAEKTSRPRV